MITCHDLTSEAFRRRLSRVVFLVTELVRPRGPPELDSFIAQPLFRS